MKFWELLLVGIGVSMDAFAVSVCKGLSVVGLRIDSSVGERFKSRAEIIGGLALIAIGVNVLQEHLRGFA